MFNQNTVTMTKMIYKTCLLSFLLLVLVQPALAAGTPSSSIFSNPLAITLMVLMFILLIIIAVLANLLIGIADLKLKERKKAKTITAVSMILLFLSLSNDLLAQDSPIPAAKPLAQTIGGLSASSFYIMVIVIFLELLVILVLLTNVRLMVKTANKNMTAGLGPEKVTRPAMSWWTRFNKFKPVEQEADIDLGHDYDGIRELDNRLPPWWLYGFYVSIVFAAVYLWRFHVSHTGPSSQQEYEQSVQIAEAKIQEYLKRKGESVNENTVTMLTGEEDLAAGKTIFASSCAACHKVTGGGDVGPNLTDDYWMHGGDVKSIFKIVKYGYNAMPQWQNTYSNKQLAQIASYVKSLKGTNPPGAKAPQGELYKEEAGPPKPAADSLTPKSNKIVMN